MKYYKVLVGCSVNGEEFVVDRVAQFDDVVAGKLLNLSPPRIVEVEPPAKRGRKKKTFEE